MHLYSLLTVPVINYAVIGFTIMSIEMLLVVLTDPLKPQLGHGLFTVHFNLRKPTVFGVSGVVVFAMTILQDGLHFAVWQELTLVPPMKKVILACIRLSTGRRL